MVIDTMFSGESKNIEYKIILPDKSEKYSKNDHIEISNLDIVNMVSLVLIFCFF